MVLKPTPHVSGLSYDVVEIFLFGHPVLPSTPRGRQLLVRRVPQAEGLDLTRPCPVVGASRRCTCAVGPISRLCIVYWPDFSHPVHPVHPKGSAFQVYQVLLGNTPWRCAHPLALSRRDVLLSMPRRRCVPSMYMCCRSIQSFVLCVEIFWPTLCSPSTPNGQHVKVRMYS